MSDTNSQAQGQETTARTRRTAAQMAEARGDAPITDALLARIVEVTEQRIAARPNPMALDTFEQIEAFAERAARTQMVPKDYVGKPDNIILAVMQGKELGLPPIQAIQSIAMVNGRPSVWGDAVPGLCYARGLVANHEEYFEGTEGTDDFTAVCVVTRKGVASPKLGRFSQADAKKAGLYGQAVHGKYPRQMAVWRARHQAFHAAFPDVLRGIGTREIEAEDAVATPGWTMPQPEKGWFTGKAQARSDGWDDTWHAGVVSKLAGEPNAWKWLDLLVSCLDDAPTLRDVYEITELPMVNAVLASAPEEAKQTMTTAFDTARARFAKDPAKQPVPETVQRGANETQQTTASTQQKSPAKLAAPATAAFGVYLMAADGTYMVDEDGVIEPYDNPVAFAQAYVAARGDLFPLDIAPFEAANKAGLAAAMIASTEVAPILAGTVATTKAETVTVDPARIPPPDKPSKPATEKFNSDLGVMLAAAETEAQVRHIADVNMAAIDAFPSSYRTSAKAMIEGALKRFAPPPAKDAAPDLNQLAQSMIDDLPTFEVEADLDAYLGFAKVTEELARLERDAPVLHEKVALAMRAKRDELAAKVHPGASDEQDEAEDDSLFGAEPQPAPEPAPALTMREIADEALKRIKVCESDAQIKRLGDGPVWSERARQLALPENKALYGEIRAAVIAQKATFAKGTGNR